MSLWNDIQPWIDKQTGLMTAPDGGRDNLILFTAYLARAMEEEPDAPITSMVPLGRSYTAFFDSAKVSRGLYLRSPGNLADNSIDNLIGACYLSPARAKDIRFRWNHYLSCFDVNNPDKIALNRNFYGRFIGVKAFIVASCGDKPWWIQRILWCASVVFSVWTQSGASNPLLLSLQVDTMRRYCPRTAAYWYRKNSLKALYTAYFGADFPITKYTK